MFEFRRKITVLQNFYHSMKAISVQIGTFEHAYNGVHSDVIFDTRGEGPWSLIFIKKGAGETLTIPICRGFVFCIVGDENYRRFREYFGISGKRGAFSMNKFFQHLSGQIPDNYQLTDARRTIILSHDSFGRPNEGIYPVGIINWEEIHAKNPQLDPQKGHRREKNAEKTRECYPDLYKAIKDMDMSVRYSIHRTAKTNRLSKGKMS